MSNISKDNGEIVIRLNKEKVSNTFFMGVLVVAALLFLYILIRGIIVTTSNIITDFGEISPSLISAYYDEYLDLYYPCPGGNWGMGQIDSLEENVSRVIDASKGEDGYFDILEDALTEEIISSMWFDSDEYRQYISFTFKPDISTDDESFKQYCQQMFQQDIDDSEATDEEGSVVNYHTILSTASMDAYGGVLMKMTLVNTYEDSETGEQTDIPLYLTRYCLRIGPNVADVTYGNLNEDDTIQAYLKYFLNNMIPNYSMNLYEEQGGATYYAG